MPVLIGASCVHERDAVTTGHDAVVISVIGSNDIHGRFTPDDGKGGVTTLSGYINALRQVRAEDGGVLLVDGGDMWQGTLESNLNEGALMVEVFNVLGYAGAAIGNHEFDFGPVGEKPIPSDPSDDPWGNLKLRASETDFPILAANLIDEATNTLVAWNNVEPSTMVEVAGVKIGIIGILTQDTKATTIASNFNGLRIAPLAETIEREARALRESGAELVVVTAHAGGACHEYQDPTDLSSCDPNSEILKVAASLPKGLVQHINGGHEGNAIAHVVNGIAVTAGPGYTQSFSRVDFTIDRGSGAVLDMHVFPPQGLCPQLDRSDRSCVWTDAASVNSVPATYEGKVVIPDPQVVAIASRAAARAAELKLEKLGVTLADRFERTPGPEAPLPNLIMDALYESLDTDVVLMNVSGGLRTDLPAGDLTYGRIFEMFPFDNRIVTLDLSGAELRKILAEQAHRTSRRAAISGVRVYANCTDDRLDIAIKRYDGQEIGDEDRVRVAVNDFIALGGDNLVTSVMPQGGFDYEYDPRLMRDVIADWLRRRGGTLHADQFGNESGRRWNLPDSLPAACSL